MRVPSTCPGRPEPGIVQLPVLPGQDRTGRSSSPRRSGTGRPGSASRRRGLGVSQPHIGRRRGPRAWPPPGIPRHRCGLARWRPANYGKRAAKSGDRGSVASGGSPPTARSTKMTGANGPHSRGRPPRQRDVRPASGRAHGGCGLPHAFPAGVSVPVAFTHDQDVRPAALITGNPHQAVEPVAAAGTVEAVLSADQAAMFIVEEGEIDLGHAAAPELSSALARPAMPWRWGTLPSVPSRSLGERLARRLVWRGLVLVTAAGWLWLRWMRMGSQIMPA